MDTEDEISKNAGEKRIVRVNLDTKAIHNERRRERWISAG